MKEVIPFQFSMSQLNKSYQVKVNLRYYFYPEKGEYDVLESKFSKWQL